jgi:hypothetical protein
LSEFESQKYQKKCINHKERKVGAKDAKKKTFPQFAQIYADQVIQNPQSEIRNPKFSDYSLYLRKKHNEKDFSNKRG